MDTLDRLARIDLNLLVALHILLDERNVTRASERLYITQPAASRTLNRLRDLFDDPLLVRQGSEMVMTPRAQVLRDRLPHTLDSVRELVAPTRFDPLTHEQQFRIAIPEVFTQAIIGGLLSRLSHLAPHMDFVFEDPDLNAHQGLLSGGVDFLIRQRREDDAQPGLVSTPLAPIGTQLLARPAHPLARKRRLGLKQVLSYPWIDCYPSGHHTGVSPADLTFEQQGYARRVLLRTTHLLAALEALSNSDCLLFLANPAKPGHILPAHCKQLPLPAELKQLGFELEIVQNRRTATSEAHNWLKQELVGQLCA